MQIRYQKEAGTKMHKCLVGMFIAKIGLDTLQLYVK